MIPRASIVFWSATAPWPSEDQVEQDLIVSRLLAEIAADPQLSETLAFRGGTCLHKLSPSRPLRSSAAWSQRTRKSRKGEARYPGDQGSCNAWEAVPTV